LSGDVSDAASIQPAIRKASELLGGGIDVLINNAGITHPERFDTVRQILIFCFFVFNDFSPQMINTPFVRSFFVTSRCQHLGSKNA
jgi:NAD(P)-dependent dehydrogenase (short-subunit alcohol dehydrogenase family)